MKIAMEKIKDKLKGLLEGLGIILLMWGIISAGMVELVGERGGLLWGAAITGLVLLSVYVYTQEKNRSYNREVNMNKKNLQINNEKQLLPQDQAQKKAQNGDWGEEMRKAANESLRKQGYKTVDWGEEMRDSFNKKLYEGQLPRIY